MNEKKNESCIRKSNIMKPLKILLLLVFQIHGLYAQKVQITFQRPVLPVLAGLENNLTGFIRVIKPQGQKVTLTGISYSLSGTTDINEVERVSLKKCNAYGGGMAGKATAFSSHLSEENHFRLHVPLKEDTTYWAFTVKLAAQADLLHRINLNCTAVEINGAEQIALRPVYAEGLRVGYPLRMAGQDGVNTSRIPGLTTSKKGTLLAIYDARWNSGRDLQGDIDIALNRSEDGGQTWTEHPTSHAVLTEPTCMASIHRHDYKKKSLLAFMNPNSYRARNQLALKFSLDEGMTWPEKYWLLLDEWGGFGYSCITSIDKETLGVVYEGSGAQIVFQKIKLSDIFK